MASMASEAPCVSGDACDKRSERLKKLRELHLRRNESRKLNQQQVQEESHQQQLPLNWEAQKERAQRQLATEQRRQECEAQGEDFERQQLLATSAEDADRWERKKRKRNPDPGFSDYSAAQERQYQRLVRQIKPDLEEYRTQRERAGEDLFPTADSLSHGSHRPSEDAISRMVTDVEKQIDKRAKFSRRRCFNDDQDIDYINERNAKFNRKAERFYGKYTGEIKQNLERGTAV
ncbi:pre-mRNA-splicing factor syf2 [Petromyzon marinus]|uniref:Pre-mRNA-splicing factor SYF2 n=1 Tax=Petromyzon marinus TaxID=7757 RepID=A0AAJ7SKJ0_PETMA|nr:pre-mRNA-splicing factor SYF2 [Petromyzon marinus]